jgi:hypothetical protein
MAWTASIRTLFCVTAMTFALAAAADATVIRSFVSNAGSDANQASNCVVTAPCRTFATALTVTQAGGEIVAMTPGGFGPLNITTSLTVIGVPGATVTASNGTVGITVNTGAGDVVIIRNLEITGANAGSNTGISASGSGRLVVEDSSLKLLQTGISVTNTKVALVRVDVTGNTTGVSATGPSVLNAGTTEVLLFFGSALFNATAYFMTNPGANNPSILEFTTQNGSFSYSTMFAGNGTLTSGTGTGCPCGSFGTFFGPNNPN